MPEKRTLEIKLAQWFPPNDPLAMQIARLCVLREYYMLEMRGLTSGDLRELDVHSDAAPAPSCYPRRSLLRWRRSGWRLGTECHRLKIHLLVYGPTESVQIT
jgi:hypothetical protein